MEEKQYSKAHKLILSNRRTGTITGVADVISFDITEGVDAAKEYTVVFKAAIFDRVVTLDSVTITTN